MADSLREIRLPFPSILVSSTGDPWMESHRASYWAGIWGCEFINSGALGHINADSGLGDWLQGLSHLQRLAARIPARGYRGAVCQSTASERVVGYSV